MTRIAEGECRWRCLFAAPLFVLRFVALVGVGVEDGVVEGEGAVCATRAIVNWGRV